MNAQESTGVGRSACSRPRVSIVIVNWNTRDTLAACLRSLIAETQGVTFEIVVVDNASSDGSVDMLRRQFRKVRVIANSRNVGFATGCNQGMRASSGDLVLLLNSDTYVVDDVVATMASYLSERPDVAMVGCQLRYPDGRVQHSAYRSLGICRSLFEDLWLYKLVSTSARNRILLGGYWGHDSEQEVDWLAGAFMLLRREIFEEVGGFAEDFFMYGEDSEWCMRMRRAGKRITYSPRGIVYHSGSVSSDLKWSSVERLRLCHVGGLRAYAKVNGRALGVLYHAARLLGAMVRLGAYSLAVVARGNRYYEEQLRLYWWMVGIYLRAASPFRERFPRRVRRCAESVES